MQFLLMFNAIMRDPNGIVPHKYKYICLIYFPNNDFICELFV